MILHGTGHNNYHGRAVFYKEYSAVGIFITESSEKSHESCLFNVQVESLNYQEDYCHIEECYSLLTMIFKKKTTIGMIATSN